jgi:hypothetical protein
LKMQRFLSFPRHFILPGLVLGFILVSPSNSHAQLPMESNSQQSAGQMAQQVADLQKVVDRWDEAVYQHDQYALELVLAPQYIDISDTGGVSNRDQQISEMMMKDAPRFQLTQKVVSVRMVGDVAVVNGTYERLFQGNKLSRTKSKTDRGVFSQVYVRARSSWECMNSQRTIIQEPVVKGKKKATSDDTPTKPLNHDLGFHLPGMHHNSDTDSGSGSTTAPPAGASTTPESGASTGSTSGTTPESGASPNSSSGSAPEAGATTGATSGTTPDAGASTGSGVSSTPQQPQQ